jgi:sn-glycerol 3-phosphate transport system ATP-binding protein
MAQVHLRGVRKSYGKLEVIHGVDIEIADGEFVVIVGPSGCGKSTLLRMVAGLERITGGEIAIGDRVVNELEPKDRDIAMVFQNYALYPHMSVYDNMAYGLKIRGSPRPRSTRASRRQPRSSNSAVPRAQAAPAFGRPAPARRHGPRHRARARGLPVRRAAVQPRCQAARADAARDQEAAARARRHLIYVTHDQVEAMTLADRLIVMNAGVAEQIGTPMDVYERPASSSSQASSARHELPGQ